MGCDSAGFDLAQGFGIDDGGLANASVEEAFVLGFEYGEVFARARCHPSFSARIHAANEDRISAMLSNQGRRFTPKDRHNGWVTLSVEGLS